MEEFLSRQKPNGMPLEVTARCVIEAAIAGLKQQ
jgi:hypothetical protein